MELVKYNTLKKMFGEKNWKINLERGISQDDGSVKNTRTDFKISVEEALERRKSAISVLKKMFGTKDGKINLEREPFWKEEKRA